MLLGDAPHGHVGHVQMDFDEDPQQREVQFAVDVGHHLVVGLHDDGHVLQRSHPTDIVCDG